MKTTKSKLVSAMLFLTAAVAIGAGPEWWHSIGSSSAASAPEYTITSDNPNRVLAANVFLGAFKVPSGGHLTMTNATIVNASNGGSLAGTLSLTVTDGTNTCTASVACSTIFNGSGVAIAIRVPLSNGAGTGCSYASGANITMSVGSTVCGALGNGNWTFQGTWS